MKQLDLGKEKISKLLLSFSIPCVISLIVNALYNIVDQVFIGWGVGYLGNGATNVVFPITVICLAFSLMLGDGSASFLSLKLGEKKKNDAEKGVSNGIISCITISILLCIVVLIFLPQLINIFGCTDALRQYALDYGGVIALGIPFMMIGTTLNSIIRADGSPKIAMTSMVIGAITNIILDPIAIFVFNMGVTGAAIATIFSQFITFIINVLYIRKFKSIKITKENFKFNFHIARTVAMLGISSFITQMAIVIVITAQNTLFNIHGANSKFGIDIPITVLGIVMKISQILYSVILGIAVGSQPIIGYNYGAKQYGRVKKTLKTVLCICFSVAIVAFILFQTIPEQLIGIFGSGDELYNEFACLTFRIFLMLIMCNSIQIASGIFFQAIGKPAKSAFLTLSRQILFFIPTAIILSSKFGVLGVIYAGPVSDGLAFLIAVTLLIFENKNLSREDVDGISKEEVKNIEDKSNKHIVITISREYGSGGRYVGKLLAEKLGIKLYDKDLITLVSNESGLSASYIEENEQNKHDNLLSTLNSQYYNNLSNDDNLFIAESNAIKEIAKKDSCIIVGRCADYVLKDEENVFSIFLYSDDESKVKRAITYYGIDENNALKEINKINKGRQKHYHYYTNQNWEDVSNYDISMNVDTFGPEKTAEIIEDIVEKKYNLIKN